jgi:hypothetical protein
MVAIIDDKWKGENFIKGLSNKRVYNNYRRSTISDDITGSIYNIYSKGTQYAKYGVNAKYDPIKDIVDYDKVIKDPKKYVVYMEVGDISRQVGPNAENFSF